MNEAIEKTMVRLGLNAQARRLGQFGRFHRVAGTQYDILMINLGKRGETGTHCTVTLADHVNKVVRHLSGLMAFGSRLLTVHMDNGVAPPSDARYTYRMLGELGDTPAVLHMPNVYLRSTAQELTADAQTLQSKGTPIWVLLAMTRTAEGRYELTTREKGRVDGKKMIPQHHASASVLEAALREKLIERLEAAGWGSDIEQTIWTPPLR